MLRSTRLSAASCGSVAPFAAAPLVPAVPLDWRGLDPAPVTPFPCAPPDVAGPGAAAAAGAVDGTDGLAVDGADGLAV
jgi:hypothetical protein